MNAQTEHVSKTSAAGRLHARTELETDEFISEQIRNCEEWKRKRLMAATERTNTNVLAKRRWEVHVGDFVPKKGKTVHVNRLVWQELTNELDAKHELLVKKGKAIKVDRART